MDGLFAESGGIDPVDRGFAFKGMAGVAVELHLAAAADRSEEVLQVRLVGQLVERARQVEGLRCGRLIRGDRVARLRLRRGRLADQVVLVDQVVLLGLRLHALAARVRREVLSDSFLRLLGP